MTVTSGLIENDLNFVISNKTPHIFHMYRSTWVEDEFLGVGSRKIVVFKWEKVERLKKWGCGCHEAFRFSELTVILRPWTPPSGSLYIGCVTDSYQYDSNRVIICFYLWWTDYIFCLTCKTN